MFEKYKSKCVLCNTTHFNFNMFKLNENLICQNCNTLCIRYNNNDIFNYDIQDLKMSLEQKKSIKTIQAEIEREQKRQQHIKERQKWFVDTMKDINFISPKVSDIKIKKQFLKNMPLYKMSSVRKTIPDFKLENFVVIDTETTGLYPAQHEILEISAIKFVDGNPMECMTTLLKPKQPIPDYITRINNISNEMVKDAPRIEYIIEDFSNFIKGFNIVGYNLEFDLNFLYVRGMDFFSEKRQFFDALQLCRRFFPRDSVFNYKLDTICAHCSIHRTQAHRATEDALATGIIFRDIGYMLKEK